jgi:hypothetical protein
MFKLKISGEPTFPWYRRWNKDQNTWNEINIGKGPGIIITVK